MFTFHEGRYVWAESHEVVDFVNWAPNQPEDTAEGDADCVWKAVSRETWRGWHDADCAWTTLDKFGEIHALCEIEA